MSNGNAPKTTSAEWDEIRSSFASSIMIDTHLNSLAQNLELSGWPIEGKEETPAKYISLSLEELQLVPGVGDKPEVLDLLAKILRETLSFDDPFGDMVTQAEEAASRDNELLKNLKKLGISEDFPLSLVNVSKDTLDFCRGEDVKTLGEFCQLSQNMAQNVIVGGDFRSLLNALSHVDEKAVARFVPFRPGEKGLHLAEAVNLALNVVPADRLAAVAQKHGLPTETAPATLTSDSLAEVERTISLRIDAMLDQFSDQKQQWEDALTQGGSLERMFVCLNNPVREAIAVRLVSSKVKGKPPPEVKSGGLFSRITGLFKRS